MFQRFIGDVGDYTSFYSDLWSGHAEAGWKFLGAEKEMKEITFTDGDRPSNGSSYWYGTEILYDVLICCNYQGLMLSTFFECISTDPIFWDIEVVQMST